MTSRLLLASAAILSLAAPSGARAAGDAHGTVLSVDAAHHRVEIVDGAHRVHGYTVGGRLPHLRDGTEVSFRARGPHISGLRLRRGRVHTVTFYARVLRAGTHGLGLRLGDGSSLRIRSSDLRTARLRRASTTRGRIPTPHLHLAADASAPVGVNVVGLTPGLTVLVTEAVAVDGATTVTITLPAAGSAAVAGENATGVVGDVGQDAFILALLDGSTVRLHESAAAINAQGLANCDTATVAYHQDGAILVADSVRRTGTSTTRDCTGGGGGGDTVGMITAISGDALTVIARDGTATSFATDDPSVTDGFAVGDVVDVSYDGTGATPTATDVEYDENATAGTVTAVSGGVLTLTDDTGASVTFTANPADGVFDGVVVGDAVTVTYHVAAAGPLADVVGDGMPPRDASSSDAGGGDGGGAPATS